MRVVVVIVVVVVGITGLMVVVTIVEELPPVNDAPVIFVLWDRCNTSWQSVV